MARETTDKKILAEKEAMRAPLLERIFEEHGDGTATLKAAAVSRPTAHRWKNEGYALPDVAQIRLMARAKNVSECWLAFASGPRDPIAAQLGNQFGENFANDPDLAHICSAWLQANEEDKALLKAWAKKFPRPKINPLATPPGKPSKPADAPPKFAKPPLSQSELLLVLGYLSDVTESSLAEKPLLIAFERLATFLAPLVAPQTPAEHSDGSLPEEGNGDTDEPSDEAGGPRSASPRR